MNIAPVIVGVAALVIIGAFHPIVIKAEYYFSYRIWPAFAAAGLALLAVSVFLEEPLSYIVGFLAVACLWSVVELFHQRRRVEKGWYPKNPRRASPQEKHGAKSGLFEKSNLSASGPDTVQ